MLGADVVVAEATRLVDGELDRPEPEPAAEAVTNSDPEPEPAAADEAPAEA